MKAKFSFPALTILLFLVSCGGGSSTSNAPTVTTIPLQVRASGFDVSVDLGGHVVDSVTADSSLTFAVTSVTGAAFLPTRTASGTVTNYGSFSGTVYSNTFDNMGLFTVNFTVTDTDGHSSSASFQVQVSIGSAMVFEDNGDVKYIDGGSGKIFYISKPDGYSETWQDNLSNGIMVFERTIGAQTDVYAYNPTTGQLVAVAVDPQKSETYIGDTSDSQILYAKTDNDGQHLRLFDPVAERTWSVSTGPIESTGDIKVGTNDEIYYRRNVNNEVCIYHFSISEGSESFVDETDDDYSEIGLHAALNNGDLVYWKKNSNGKKDLFYYASGGSTNNISVNNTTDATYEGNTSLGHVLYTSNGNTNLLFYNLDTKTTTDLGAGSTYDTDMVGGAYVVYTDSSDDIKVLNITAAATTTIATGAGAADYKGKFTDDKTLVFSQSNNLSGCDITKATGTGSIATPIDINSGAGNCTFSAILANNDVVFTKTATGKIGYYDYSASSVQDINLAGGSETYVAKLGHGVILFTGSFSNGDYYIYDTVNATANLPTKFTNDDASSYTYLYCGSFDKSQTETAISITQTITTNTTTTRAAKVLYFSKGNDYYTVKRVTTVINIEVYDSSTGATTYTYGTPSSTISSPTRALQNVDDVFQVSTSGDETAKAVYSLTE